MVTPLKIFDQAYCTIGIHSNICLIMNDACSFSLDLVVNIQIFLCFFSSAHFGRTLESTLSVRVVMMTFTQLGYLSKYFCPYLSKYFCQKLCKYFWSKIMQIFLDKNCANIFGQKLCKYFCQKLCKYFWSKLCKL